MLVVSPVVVTYMCYCNGLVGISSIGMVLAPLHGVAIFCTFKHLHFLFHSTLHIY